MSAIAHIAAVIEDQNRQMLYNCHAVGRGSEQRKLNKLCHFRAGQELAAGNYFQVAAMVLRYQCNLLAILEWACRSGRQKDIIANAFDKATLIMIVVVQ